MLSTVLFALLIGSRANDGDDNLVEALRDAQTTHREAWLGPREGDPEGHHAGEGQSLHRQG